MNERIKAYLRNQERISFDETDVMLRAEELEQKMKSVGNCGLALGGYAYYPSPAFKAWTASDGSKIRSTTALLILDYGGKDSFTSFLYSDNFEEFIVKGRKGQADYEAGVMRGDHY